MKLHPKLKSQVQILSKWFVIHDLLAYNQHKDLIGNVVKAEGVKHPKSSNFSNIKKDDLLVYYASKDSVVVGIFKVVSDIEYLPNDKYWKEVMVYKIQPIHIPKEGYYLDFKKLIKDSKINFDLFPEKPKWGAYLQGKTCISLTDKDFSLIKDSITTDRYLDRSEKFKAGITNWHKKQKITQINANQPKEIKIHQAAIDKWKTEEEKRFGGFIKPQIETNVVDLNDILPKDIWLNKNKKYLDAISRLDIGGQPFYQSVLEVQHKGSKEDLCVRVSIVLPFVTRVDIISDEEVLDEIKELLERVADPHIVKTRCKFYSFDGYLGTNHKASNTIDSPKEYFPQ